MSRKDTPPKGMGKKGTKHGLGRLFAPDQRDAMYPMSLVKLPKKLPVYKYWLPGKVLDQNGYPRCVAFAWKQWLQSNPIRQGQTLSEKALYDAAQKIDEWPGENYSGTSVRAGAKVLQTQEYITTYLWATAIDQLKAWILAKGPVVIGTRWYNSMFLPDRNYVVHPGGGVAGGHAYLIIGYNSGTKMFRCINSWGVAWGEQGKFWVSEADMQLLVYAEHGEAVTAVEHLKVAV